MYADDEGHPTVSSRAMPVGRHRRADLAAPYGLDSERPAHQAHNFDTHRLATPIMFRAGTFRTRAEACSRTRVFTADDRNGCVHRSPPDERLRRHGARPAQPGSCRPRALSKAASSDAANNPQLEQGGRQLQCRHLPPGSLAHSRHRWAKEDAAHIPSTVRSWATALIRGGSWINTVQELVLAVGKRPATLSGWQLLNIMSPDFPVNITTFEQLRSFLYFTRPAAVTQAVVLCAQPGRL